MKIRRFFRINISFFLIFMIGGIIACSRQDRYPNAENDFFDDTFAFQNTGFSFDDEFSESFAMFDNIEFALFNVDFVFMNEFAFAWEDFIFDRYGDYIDDVFVSVLTANEFNNTLLILDDHQININRIIGNLAIGTGAIMVTSLVLPAVAPGIAPQVAILAIRIVNDALIGAAINAGIMGAIEYFQSGDITAAGYKTIEGASEGFMWGAVISSVMRPFTALRVMNRGQGVDGTLVNFSQANSRNIAAKANLTQISGLTRNEYRNAIRSRYGQEGLTDIFAFTGNSNRYFQAVARGERVSPAIQQRYLPRVNRLNTIFSSEYIPENMVFPRGERMPRDVFSNIFGIEPLGRRSNNEIARMVIGKNTHNPAFTSANLPTTPRIEVNDWAIYGRASLGRSVQSNDIMLIRELNAPAGTRGFDVTRVSIWGHEEFVFPRGLRTRVDSATVERITDRNGNIFEVIRTFETIIP
jgi:hypothetical protein